ncbi:hypothetical protein OIU34_23270 [Pararhizobium sp. BT-229]|uniref:hypothetical protein n=1 Tax=Pararhizobium sp. BT-229 TaxID=2986923 RepID=UPI0021F69D3A|nr:hypothetical protein [Pararhizobium sp. BT-229]MCV9964817.1 hypothetical protein [Pararhizobium sp. BT-229]
MPVITVKKVDSNGAVVALHEKGRYVFDGMVFHLEEKVRRYSPTVNRIALVRGHAFAPALTNNEKAIRVGMYVSGHMYGQKAYSFMESLGMADVQRVLDDVYDRDTHTYEVMDQTLIFRDLATGDVGNPRGPATIDMSDPKNVIAHDVVREPAVNRTGYLAANDDEGLEDEIELANMPRQEYRQFGM